MRCHFIYDKGVKILIPGCYGSIYREDLSNCTCVKTPSQFAKEKYNKVVNDLKSENDQMAKHIKYLTRIIDKLIKTKK